MPYAEGTEVPVPRSKEHLEALLRRAGAQGFASAWDPHGDLIEFMWKGLRIRFHLPKKDPKEFRLTKRGQMRTPTQLTAALEQDHRQRWRALFLVVKAKIEAVESGISVFEEEFLAHIVDPATDRTVGHVLVPRIQNKQQLLLGAADVRAASS